MFEKVISKHILKYLFRNSYTIEGQCGSVPRWRTQTAASTYKDIYQTLMQGAIMVTVFLDFAETYNEVNYTFLLDKVRKQNKKKISYGKWMKEFLKAKLKLSSQWDYK